MSYSTRKKRVVKEFREALASGKTVGLGKKTSNLFRHRKGNRVKVDVSDFNHVLHIDTKKGFCEVEGMTTYEELVDATLQKGFMPTVVPELKTITIGGAFTGVGIESSSFKYGLVHETVLECEILLSDGRVITCSPRKNSDLFYGFPNSYGSLGYVLKLKVKIVPVKDYVKIQHQRFSTAQDYFKAVEKACKRKDLDFVDGSIFSPQEYYLTTGTFVDSAPHLSDYTGRNMYFKSIKEASEDYLCVKDYIWRWDTDWFWCSKHFGVQNPVVRFFWPKKLLCSKTYWTIRSWYTKSGLSALMSKVSGRKESIIQDVEIPVEHAATFITWFLKTIGVTPVWMCPTRAYKGKYPFTLYPLDAKKLYINFGFWDVKKTNKPPGYYNRRIEKKVRELKGMKSLYSDAYYSEEEFWEIYPKRVYLQLKKKYDPQGKLKGLYEKVVKRI
ncbi:FAD-binding oxidoreductase [Candidatus Woesearchaeota archaeon]|nr:MAG: FAD-binding oxidoreductase [Candidatus Woesearchaeota archaeon]